MVKKSIQTTAIIGFIAKGFVYVVIGVLSLLAALNLGGESSGTNSALLFLKKQPFGQFLLTALAVGLLCYSYWMFVKSIQDPEKMGSSKSAKVARFGVFTTGVVYTFLALLAFYHLFNAGGGENDTQYLDFLGPTLISVVFICIGVILLIQAGILAVGIFKGSLLKQFNLEGQTGSKILRIGGKFGFYSRAFVVVIIAYFFLRAGIYSGNHEIKGIQDAFAFLHQSFLGRILMAVTAIGFISYGLFYILLSRYKTFE